MNFKRINSLVGYTPLNGDEEMNVTKCEGRYRRHHGRAVCRV
jgi:hypothetical protein